MVFEKIIMVYSACGSSNSAIELYIDEQKTFGHVKWVDVCNGVNK